MLSVDAALDTILKQTGPLGPVRTALTSSALGAVLAEDIVSDLDMPPHDKALMDGYAVRSADVPDGEGTLSVIEEITAGRSPTKEVGPGQASRIMTGAPMPAGADAVIQIERTRMLEDGRVAIADRPPRPLLNMLPRGQEMRRGETILTTGTRLRPQEFGVLATVGRTEVQAIPAPQVHVLTTGDEVVEPDQNPGPAQIRNSNGPMLMAQTTRAGGDAHYLGIARDRPDSLRELVAQGLQGNVLILSGGVSAGKLDLVPDILREAGVTSHFHHVAMKPGKPLFFGTLDRPGQPGTGTLVFGLPGNPVSSFVCFELFIRPALNRLRGIAKPGPNVVSARLSETYTYRSDRPTYHPAWLEALSGGWEVRVVPWFGSADLRGLLRANALILFPAVTNEHDAGQRFDVVALDTAT